MKNTEEIQRKGKLIDSLPAVTFEYSFFVSGIRDFVYISPRCEKMFGLTQTEILSGELSMQSYIHPQDWPRFRISIIEKSKNFDHSDWRWEGRVKVPQGYLWIEAIASGEVLNDGTITWVGIIHDIGHRKQVEQRQCEMEQRLELALKGADLGLWDYNYQTNETELNKQWSKILGYDHEELLGMQKTYEDFIHPDDLHEYTRIMTTHRLSKSDSFSCAYRFKIKNGAWRWVLEKGQIVERDTQGNPIRSVGIIQDFEEHKIKEKAVQESEERYRQLVDHIPMGVSILQDGKVKYINKYGINLLADGQTDEVLGKPFMRFIAPENEQLTTERVARVLAGEEVSAIEQIFVCLNGQHRIVEALAMPFRYGGKPAVQSIFRDVTDQKKAETEKRKSETLFSQLFHVSPMAIAMLDDQGKVQQVNEGFEAMFGYSSTDLQGKSLNEFIVPENLESEGNDLNTLISSQQVVRIETVRLHRDGHILSVIIYGMPIMIEGVAIGIFGVYVDITEQKKTEEELKTRNAELDNFVYKVSHDLRAPLSSVRGLVNLAKLPENKDDPAEYLTMIGRKVDQLDHFITDVLSHSKNLKMDLRIEPIDFKNLIDQTFTDLNYLKGADEIMRSLTIEGETFMSDRWRIGEIFRNLISNAIKYRNFRKPDPEIIIEIRVTEKMAFIKFSDNGIGIQPESMEKIFHMFYRASEQSDGSGLGLYIVKNAVEKLGGHLDVKSTYGEGTTFTFELPNRSV
ncbi:MAG: PAS domain S-box protein [Bacteroidetes bacterium]|nr:PAS domain S-box protein [Bacteroidota bacterium]MBS1540149.1 PAS domain S-box protein [Bacteroidota bacterium]